MRRKRTILWVAVVALAVAFAVPALRPAAHALPADGDFSLQVTPSPLVATIKPGQLTELELKIRNAGTQTEALKIEPRSFTINATSQQVKLDDTTPPNINWISFSQPLFTVQPGAWATEEVRLSPPKDTGFSYSFALVISRQKDPQPISGGRLIKGSVAIFTLVNIDRPGATSTLGVAKFSSTKHVYEYLPSTLSVTLKNTGNTIVQPFGTIFIQRGANSQNPLATLAVNGTKGYVLPGTDRTFTAQWADGFPAYKSVTASDGTTKQKLGWNWSKLSSFRFGRYTAKLVAVYNDGTRDIPIQGEISFWVIPWKILLGVLLVLILLLFGLWSLTRKIIRVVKRVKNRKSPISQNKL